MGACQSKKALKAALKKRRMEKMPKGQRISSGDGTALPKRPSNSQVSSPAPSQVTTPNHSVAAPGTGNLAAKGKKVLKTTLKEAASRKTLISKPKLSSSSVSNRSPATLHGRVLQKTATVSPAPPKTNENSPCSLTRFGFKNGPPIASGDSTDSVNSILSDVQTTSDANSNIFDFGDENFNGASDLISKFKLQTTINNSSSLNPRAASPCTISQASSGVTSLLNGKIKAQTKQLPSPQIVTVKAMNNNKKQTTTLNGSLKSRYSSPILRKTVSPQRSPVTIPKDQRSKIHQNATKSSLPRAQKVPKETESSNRSLSTIDSGLGSSLESEKSRSPKILALKGEEKSLDTGQEADRGKENGFDLDVSDAWLKDKHSRQETYEKVNETNEKVNPRLNEGSVCRSIPRPLAKSQKECFKDKRDSNITYGMARQKFAPYSRNRFAYQTSSNRYTSYPETSLSKQESLSQTKSHSGIVRSRIAQLEKTPLTSTTDKSCQKVPKKPAARPTSFEKTPILVSSKSENTVELSRSICRRLEYSEGKSSLLDNVKDNKNENLMELPTTAQDLLMVDSFEVRKGESVKNSEIYGPSTDSNKISVSLPADKTLSFENESCESKRIKDITECENSIKRLSDDLNNSKDSDAFHLSLPDSAAKIFSPDGSETSFEVLESGSVDLSPRDDAEVGTGNNIYLTQLVAGFSNASESTSCAKHSQNSPSRVVPIKKSRQEPENKDCGYKCEEETHQGNAAVFHNEVQTNGIDGSKSIMESSLDSNRMSDSGGDRWTVSGKCTPSLSSTRGDNDQDFLIDDEISDQPGLTFGDDLDASLFGDEDLFSDISSPSATHILSKTERSRHGSMGTASSLGPDDLMLDYDVEDPKQYGYEEEVLSPVACDILSEWSAILSGTHSPSCSSPQPCVSQQTGVLSTACSNNVGTGLCTTQTQTTSVTTHQPLTAESPTLSRSCSIPSRSRTCSAGSEFAFTDAKRGVNLKPPRQGISSEHDGGLNIDRTTLHYICQDVTTMKTLLHRLRRVLQVTDTINPFDANLKTSLYLNLGVNDSFDKDDPNSAYEVVQQNVDLKRQVVLLQQRLEEKDRTIRSLQQQLSQSLQKSTSPTSLLTPSSSSCLASSFLSSDDGEMSSSSKTVSNAATQTERNSQRSSPFSLAAMSRTSSVEDGLGPTVSFESVSARRLMNDSPSTAETSEKEEVSSPKKKYPLEFIAASSPKLSLVPIPSTVAESLGS